MAFAASGRRIPLLVLGDMVEDLSARVKENWLAGELRQVDLLLFSGSNKLGDSCGLWTVEQS